MTRPGTRPALSVIVPVLHEGTTIRATLGALQAASGGAQEGESRADVEFIVVDGGSRDDTVAQCEGLADRVLHSPAGRARQMNAGAAAARGRLLLFLHADTTLPPDGLQRLRDLAVQTPPVWGRFDVRIAGRPWMLRVVAAFMNRRSRWTGIATGDQAIFISRDLFDRVGGFPEQPLMEDIEISRRLKRVQPPLCRRERVTTSGRRWEQRGVWRTILLMWALRWRYWRGESAETLARLYR